LGKEEKGLWVDIVKSKYGTWRCLVEGKDNRDESIWWRNLKKTRGWSVSGKWFMGNILWNVGDGNKILFWKDLCLGDTSLAFKYMKLFVSNYVHKLFGSLISFC